MRDNGHRVQNTYFYTLDLTDINCYKKKKKTKEQTLWLAFITGVNMMEFSCLLNLRTHSRFECYLTKQKNIDILLDMKICTQTKKYTNNLKKH